MNETTKFYVFCMIVYMCLCVCVYATFSFINVWESDTEFEISNRITTPKHSGQWSYILTKPGCTLHCHGGI